MNYQSSEQLQETFNLAAEEFQKIIENNNIQSAYTEGQETYFEIESIECYIQQYLDKKNKSTSVNELKEIYKMSEYGIRTLITNNQIEPVYNIGRKQFYDIDEVDFFIQMEKEQTTYFKARFVISQEFEIGDDLTTKRILEFNNIQTSLVKGKAQYYDIRQVTPVLAAYKRSKTVNDLVNIYKIRSETVKKLNDQYNISPIYTSENGYTSYYDFDQIKMAWGKLFDELSDAKEKFKTLNQISVDHNISNHTLIRIVNETNIEPRFVSHTKRRYFDEEEILNVFRHRAIERDYVNIKPQTSFYDKLHHDLQQIIDDYLQFRESGLTIKSRIYTTKKRTIAHSDKNIKRIKSTISSVLFKVGQARNELTNNTKQIYFDLYSLNQQDILPLREALSNTTLVTAHTTLLPFLGYLLELERKKALINNDMSKYSIIEMNFEDFLNQFPLDLEDGDKPPVEKTKSFLTREQCIDVYNLLLSNPRGNLQLRNATMWLISVALGVRPEEMILLRIDDFLLDDNGFLTTNELGWGLLNVRKEVSKGEKSPSSHRQCKTPVPQNAVLLINNYLRWLYQKQGNNIPKGVGYLFRTHAQVIESRLQASSNEAINQVAPFLNFLTPEQQKDFEFKAGRRSLNTFFIKAVDIMPETLKNWKLEKARQHQMRHAADASTQFLTTVQQARTGSRHYTEDLSQEDYYAILDYIITFPWNKKELILWEIEKGYRNPNTEININFKNELEKKDFEIIIEDEKQKQHQQQNEIKQQQDLHSTKLHEKLQSIENQLNEMKTAPEDDVNFEKWLKIRANLQKEKKEILAYLAQKGISKK